MRGVVIDKNKMKLTLRIGSGSFFKSNISSNSSSVNVAFAFFISAVFPVILLNNEAMSMIDYVYRYMNLCRDINYYFVDDNGREMR